MGLFVRTIGIARATVKMGLANIAYNMKRKHGLEFGAWDVGPWQEIVDLAVGVAVDDPSDDVGEIAERLEFAGFDQRSGDGPVFGAAVGAGEKRILSVERPFCSYRSGC